MIDATVYENGRGEVTAKNLNLAMHGVVDATEEKIAEVEEMVAEIGENGVGGSGALRVWGTEEGVELTPEQIAENVTTYNKLMSGEHANVIMCIGYEEDDFKAYTSIPIGASAFSLGKLQYVVLQAVMPTEPETTRVITMMAKLDADGTVTIFYGEDEPASEGGSAIAYVNIPMESELTEEQIAENAEAYKKIANGEAVMMMKAVDAEMGYTATVTPQDIIAFEDGIMFTNAGIFSYSMSSDNLLSNFKHSVQMGIFYPDGTVEIEYFEEAGFGENVKVYIPAGEPLANSYLEDNISVRETTISYPEALSGKSLEIRNVKQNNVYAGGTIGCAIIYVGKGYLNYVDGTDIKRCTIAEDGNVTIATIGSVTGGASNGPLTFYIGYLTTLSAEERITTEQKEHNAAMFEIYKSSPYALGVFVDQSEIFSASNGMSGRAIKTSVPYQAQYFPVETGAEAIMLKQKITDNSEIGIIIFPDGSVYRANELE